MSKLKPFKELTPQGQTRRLNKYRKEYEERGTTQTLARIAVPVRIKEIKDDNKLAVIRVAIYDKETKETAFKTMTAFIKKGKDALENFYASLQVGQLVSVEYKTSNGYNNIYNLMDRSYADNRKKKDDDEIEI